VMESGFDHLVYFNPDWKDSTHNIESDTYSFLYSSCPALDAMGCFYTLTPKLIQKIGFFDEKSFPIRGHSHIDYTMRICRGGGNVVENVFDVKNSNDYIGMIMRENYIRTNRKLSVSEILLLSSANEMEKRLKIINSEYRNYIDKGW